MEDKTGKFDSQGTGFRMTFENGYTISVQFGACTYSDHYMTRREDLHNRKTVESSLAEVAISKQVNGRLVWHLDPDEGAYKTPAEVAKLIALAQAL